MTCPHDHKHAVTATCYSRHRCRCVPCRLANNKRQEVRRKSIAYGRHQTTQVQIEPVLAHIAVLRAVGLGRHRIARLADVSSSTIQRAIAGSTRTMHRDVAARILAVETNPELGSPAAWTSPTGARRRVQALVSRGWSQASLARELGITPQALSSQLYLGEHIYVRTHLAIVGLFDRLWNVEPPRGTRGANISYARARAIALRRGWVAPLAWDDIDTDPEPERANETDSAIDDVAVDLAVSGQPVRLTVAEREESVRRLHALRWSDQKIASQIRTDQRTVLRIRGRLGLRAFEYHELEKAA